MPALKFWAMKGWPSTRPWFFWCKILTCTASTRLGFHLMQTTHKSFAFRSPTLLSLTSFYLRISLFCCYLHTKLLYQISLSPLFQHWAIFGCKLFCHSRDQVLSFYNTLSYFFHIRSLPSAAKLISHLHCQHLSLNLHCSFARERRLDWPFFWTRNFCAGCLFFSD